MTSSLPHPRLMQDDQDEQGAALLEEAVALLRQLVELNRIRLDVDKSGSAAPTAASPADPQDGARLIDREEFEQLLGIAQPTFKRWLASKRIPPPIALSSTCHRWRRVEVLAWIEAGCPKPADQQHERKRKR